MAEMLFVGGPLHGQVRNVEADRYSAPIPAGQRSMKDPSGIPILTSFDTVVYVPRKFASASGRYRRVMAVEAMPPGEVLQALADVLITIWVESGDLPERSTDAPEESGPAGGPAATLAGDR
jgi:hypothetical protein